MVFLNDPIKQSGLNMICACVWGGKKEFLINKTKQLQLAVCVYGRSLQHNRAFYWMHKAEMLQTNK